MLFQLHLRCRALLIACSLVLGPASAEIIRTEGGMPETLPKVPFELPRPEPKDSQDNPIKAEVLAKASAEALYRGSYQFQSEGDMTRAIFLRSQGYKKNSALQGKFELAGWCAQAKDLDTAIYWLQQAALSDQLDEVTTDQALEVIRADERWAKLKPFLATAEKTWTASSYWRTVLVVPARYDASKPIPLLLTLHGMGSVPEDFVDDPAYQELADELQIGILGISGTKPEGKNRFGWQEKFEEDWKHQEHPATLAASKSIVEQFQKIEAGVSSHAFIGDTHSSPPAPDEHLSLWVQFLLAGKRWKRPRITHLWRAGKRARIFVRYRLNIS